MLAATARAPYAGRLRFAIRSRRICCGSYVRRRRSARFRVELYFRALICSEILRRAMALNSILREILEF